MSRADIILEGLSSVLYHSTDQMRAGDILSSNTFNLTIDILDPRSMSGSIWADCIKYHIPCYFYADRSAFLSLDKRKAVPEKVLRQNGKKRK